MGLPVPVDGWIVGSGDDSTGWVKLGNSAPVMHRVAYKFISDNGNTLTYRIYHQSALYVKTHLMTGHSATYEWHINGASASMVIKNGDDRWNNGTPGRTADYRAVRHYVSTVGPYGGNCDIHAYLGNDKYGKDPNPQYAQCDVTFNKSKDGIVNISMDYHTGPGDSAMGMGQRFELRLPGNSFTLDTGRPSYTPPQTWLNDQDYTKIGIPGSTSYNIHYSMTAGTDPLKWSRLHVTSYNKSLIWEKTYDRTSPNSGYWDSYILPKEKFDYGKNYRISISIYDGKTEVWSPNNTIEGGDGLFIYTYQKPSISSSISVNDSIINALQTTQFKIYNINQRVWSQYEENFETRLRIKAGDKPVTEYKNIGNVSSWNPSVSEIRSYVPKSEDNKPVTIYMKRYSPSSGLWSDLEPTATFKVIYRPLIDINRCVLRLNSSSGRVIEPNSLVKYIDIDNIHISWNYNTSDPKAGYIQGYRVRLYDKDKSLKKSYYTTSKSLSIPKEDIPKFQNTYIDITPYYKNDSDNPNNYWYYAGNISYLGLVNIISDPDKPVITYPIDNSIWLNDDYRILFTLPYDGYSEFLGNAYRYYDIEIELNSLKFSALKVPKSISSALNNLTYKKNITIYPNYNNQLPKSNTYKIRLRVATKYSNGSAEVIRWSEWSDYRTINIKKSNYKANKNQIILASDYNNLKKIIDTSANVYSIASSDSQNVNLSITTIQSSQFTQNRFIKTINDIKNKVNNFTAYDNNNVKFDMNNLIITSFTPQQEIITADNQDVKIGRNYIQIAYDNINNLK